MPASPVQPPLPAPFDAAIVLGAVPARDGGPGPAMERRVRHGVALARSGQVAHLLMTGGAVTHPVPEAAIMRDLAVSLGLAPERVLTEEAARNTIENARLSLPIVAAQGWRRLLVVTDTFHLPRALYAFRRHGLEVRGSAAPPPEAPGRDWWLAWVREAAALPWTMIRLERALWRRQG